MKADELRQCSWIMSSPYSMDPNGRGSWRYWVCDVHVFVLGSWHLQESMRDAFEGAACDLSSLQFGPKDDVINTEQTTNTSHQHLGRTVLPSLPNDPDSETRHYERALFIMLPNVQTHQHVRLQLM